MLSLFSRVSFSCFNYSAIHTVIITCVSKLQYGQLSHWSWRRSGSGNGPGNQSNIAGTEVTVASQCAPLVKNPDLFACTVLWVGQSSAHPVNHARCLMCSHTRSLQHNSIQDRGAISVAAGLKLNHSLRNLRQEPNPLCVCHVHMRTWS